MLDRNWVKSTWGLLLPDPAESVVSKMPPQSPEKLILTSQRGQLDLISPSASCSDIIAGTILDTFIVLQLGRFDFIWRLIVPHILLWEPSRHQRSFSLPQQSTMHRLYDAIHRRNSYLGAQTTYAGKINDHEACSFQPCKRRALFNHARGEYVYLCLSTERQIGQGSTTMTRRWLTLRSHQ